VLCMAGVHGGHRLLLPMQAARAEGDQSEGPLNDRSTECLRSERFNQGPAAQGSKPSARVALTHGVRLSSRRDGWRAATRAC
jgi:hypothetical protein